METTKQCKENNRVIKISLNNIEIRDKKIKRKNKINLFFTSV